MQPLIPKVFKKKYVSITGEPMNYIEFQKKYGGGFVAILHDEVVAHGKTFGDVLDEVKRREVLEDENLTFDFIEEEGAVCVYRVPYV